jgi:hypothetical protein
MIAFSTYFYSIFEQYYEFFYVSRTVPSFCFRFGGEHLGQAFPERLSILVAPLMLTKLNWMTRDTSLLYLSPFSR